MKIISIVANNPIFIELQYKTLKRFVDIDYEYIIFNDGKDWADITNFNNPNEEGKNGIIKKCIELGIKYINIPNKHHKTERDASKRHTDSSNFVLKFMRQFKDEYLMLDSDMFLIDKIDFNIYRKFNCACVLQTRSKLTYIWPNLFYINMNKIRNSHLLDLSIIPGGDTGSASSRWLNAFNYAYPTCESTRKNTIQCYSNSDFYYINHLSSGGWNEAQFPSNLNKILLNYFKGDVRNSNNQFFSEIYDNKILHYRAGTNWMNENKAMHNKNIANLISSIDYLLNFL
jgi:hypothetical protein